MASEPLAIVTGAAHRIGGAFAARLAGSGYAILLHFWNSEKDADTTAELIKQLGVPAYLCRADLSRPEGIRHLFAEVDQTGHLPRVLVNSAGVMQAGNPRTLTVQEWDQTLNLNLRAPFLCAQEAADRMKQGGLIVNVTDVGARKSWSRFPAYSVSKAGLEAMTRILARAFAPEIRVNAIAPGLTLRSKIISEEEWQQLIRRLPLKRPAAVEELASALEFLLQNEYVTGETLVVDGGYSLLG
jgi:NAD(P)-dependent dehydrogenase (short-subunit alcohol dehydrogenase family)